MTKLNQRIVHLEIPQRMTHLEISDEGYPVPWFVGWINGKPDFRLVDPEKLVIATRHKKCFLCGENLGVYMTFVIGPMCAVNRTSAEPPSHRSCALYAVKACPFLTQPRMRRNEKDMPIDATKPAGEMIRRNPGVSLLWTTKIYTTVRLSNGLLFKIGDPETLEFWSEGQYATKRQVLDSINSGLPILQEMAEEEGQIAVAKLKVMTNDAMKLIQKGFRNDKHV
jgi:hypothetical protein